jgi:peroxiredoxin Q/BCP
LPKPTKYAILILNRTPHTKYVALQQDAWPWGDVFIGAWGEKKNYGRAYFGIIRSTFIIDEAGLIVKVFPKVKPEGHGEEILAALKI